jgi:hypothetical protein
VVSFDQWPQLVLTQEKGEDKENNAAYAALDKDFPLCNLLALARHG